MRVDPGSRSETVMLSLVLPVYNNASTLESVIHNLLAHRCSRQFEIVLVNNGSTDDTQAVCDKLHEKYPSISVIHLSRTFGTDNAVLAGLRYATGQYAAVLGAAGQPGIANVLRMLEELRSRNCDAVFGAQIPAAKTWAQRVRSRLGNRMASLMLQKPADVPLFGFKVMNRFVIDEIVKYTGSFPFVDGLIYRSTRNIQHVELSGAAIESARSELSMSQRVAQWSNMFFNFSILPLRISAYGGLIAAALSVFALALIWIDKIYFTKDLTPGIRTTLAVISFFAGIQLMLLGLVGEYLGRLFLDQTGTPQAITRYVKSGRNAPSFGRSPNI